MSDGLERGSTKAALPFFKRPLVLRATVVVAALVLFVLLFTAPKLAPPKEAAPLPVADIAPFVESAVRSLDPSQKQKFGEWVKAGMSDSLVKGWLKLKRQDVSAYYAEFGATRKKTAAAWLEAGKRYYNAVQFCDQETEVPALFQSAVRCLKTSLAFDPGNKEAMLTLARCYVEGTDKPMDGITILKVLEKNDSNNVELNLAFAAFSVKSRQMDKAIRRFEKVLKADSTYIYAYLGIADCYEQMGDTKKTIEMLERYVSLTPDVSVKAEFRKYIDQLKQGNNN